MALAARLWRFLPWGRRVFPGPWLSRGVAGSRGLCCTRRLRGSEVSPPPSRSPRYWLGSGTLLFSLAAPYRHGECGELRKVVLRARCSWSSPGDCDGQVLSLSQGYFSENWGRRRNEASSPFFPDSPGILLVFPE